MTIVKNRQELCVSKLRKDVLDIIEAGVARVLPDTVMRSTLRYNQAQRVLAVSGHGYDVSKGRIFVVGGGKASGAMAETLEQIIAPHNISAGIVTCKGRSDCYRTVKIQVMAASHPVPDQRGVSGVKQMLALKTDYSIGKNDVVLCLISGGGSALMPCPVDGVSLRDKQRVTALLLRSGAEIHEINVVRKHLSKTKGGRLGTFFSPATVISLILSDVVGDDLAVIASGPTVPDPSTFSEAYEVLSRYDLSSKLPRSALNYLIRGCKEGIEATPKTLENCSNFVIGNNKLALEAMEQKAREMGLTPYIITSNQKGDAGFVAQLRASEILVGKYIGYDVVLAGGETTLKLSGVTGKGGRNQHYTIVSMLEMREYLGEWVIACIGTDGSDFLPDVAGAIIDNNSLSVAGAKGLNVKSYIDGYDSHTLLKKIGTSLIVTGDTGTNVGDIIAYAWNH